MEKNDNQSNWHERALSEITTYISRGVTPKYTEDKKNSVLVLNQRCVRDGKIVEENARYNDPLKRKITEEKSLRDYDILVNSTGVGTLGRVSQIQKIKRQTTVDSHVTIVRAAKNILDPIYLGYSLKTQQRLIESLGEGSTGQTELSRKRLGEEIIVRYPEDIQEQEKIATILKSLDDKIEINNQMNQTLEEMAQAIFKEWFVEFNFPITPNFGSSPLDKGEGGKILGYKDNGGEMVESELGGIPKGWRVGIFKDILNISSGKRPNKKSKDKNEDFKIPVIGAGGVMAYTKESNVNKNVLVIGRVGTLGVVQRINKKSWLSDNTLVIDSDYHEYSYQNLKMVNYTSINRGSTQPLITQGDMKVQNIIIPPKDVLYKYETLAGSLFDKIEDIIEQNETLIKTRDTLLPKLMSGEVRV